METPSDNEEEVQNQNIFGDDEEDETSGNRDDEAQEVPEPGSGQVIKPKRVIKNPQPKLDAIRLMGPRGVGILQSTFKDIKFKGKGHEKEDLNMVIKRLEHWAHRLFPKLPFEDTLKQIEKLGTKKPVQNMMKRIRLDMFQSDEFVSSQDQETDEPEPQSNPVPEVDVFDELLGTGYSANNAWSTVQTPAPVDQEVAAPNSQAVKTSTLTAEQLERIERNRLLALEKRKAKQLLKEKEKLSETEDMDSTCEITELSSFSKPLSVLQTNTNSDDQFSQLKSISGDDKSSTTESCSSIDPASKENQVPTDFSPMKAQMETDVPMEEEETCLNSKEKDEISGTCSEKELKGMSANSSQIRNKNQENKNDTNMFTEDDVLSFINDDNGS